MTPILVPLATHSQIARTPSGEDGLPQELEEDLRAFGCKLIHQAGILLNQKQVAVATAQILFQRFWFVTSLKQFSIGDISMGALYLASKLEECPIRMRDLINVYDLLLQRNSHELSLHSSPPPSSPSRRPQPTHVPGHSLVMASPAAAAPSPSNGKTKFKYTPMAYFSDAFYNLKDALVVAEMQILKRLGFNMLVVLPYGTLINYLRLLGLTNHKEACGKAWGYLNDALVFLPPILLATRHLGISLPSTPPNSWWDLFDASWEDVWIVCGHIMRLYRDRTLEERLEVMRMVNKKEVRKWLEENNSL
ncbi:cyclin-like protein [Pisolithus orientalis]|uniref:cyclin-like protein n=1 Tax=Pisolithus orientalis TaxID=936130 RepID=UPI002225B0D5|nr:cyclin-like protein [Pisolithus orientalis]KAI6019666.1 cyclin-like protein [Pisolithus orientalis]